MSEEITNFFSLLTLKFIFTKNCNNYFAKNSKQECLLSLSRRFGLQKDLLQAGYKLGVSEKSAWCVLSGVSGRKDLGTVGAWIFEFSVPWCTWVHQTLLPGGLEEMEGESAPTWHPPDQHVPDASSGRVGGDGRRERPHMATSGLTCLRLLHNQWLLHTQYAILIIYTVMIYQLINY